MSGRRCSPGAFAWTTTPPGHSRWSAASCSPAPCGARPEDRTDGSRSASTWRATSSSSTYAKCSAAPRRPPAPAEARDEDGWGLALVDAHCTARTERTPAGSRYWAVVTLPGGAFPGPSPDVERLARGWRPWWPTAPRSGGTGGLPLGAPAVSCPPGLAVFRHRLRAWGVDRVRRAASRTSPRRSAGRAAPPSTTGSPPGSVRWRGPAARGLMNREIAVVLHLSPRTVEQHVARALRKTDALSRRDLLPTSQTPAPDSSSFSSASVTVREGSGGPPRGVEFVRGLSPRSGPCRPRPRPRCGAGPPTGSRGRPR
ncbi:hypothetical protein STENM327S_03569 [Streptomyces tendae]